MNFKFMGAIALYILGVAACDPKPIVNNEEELITTLQINFVSQSGVDTVKYKFVDLDGSGSASPSISNVGNLKKDSSYNTYLELFNESANPVEDIGAEILAEKEDHQFFYQSDTSAIAFSYDDVDANAHPIGLKSKASVKKTGTHNLTITLRHQPNKSATNVAAGDITNAGGETDIEVQFNLNIQ